MTLHLKRRHLYHLAGIILVGFCLILWSMLILDVEGPRRLRASLREETPDSLNAATAQREWKEIFLKDRKVGYAVSMLHPTENGFFIQEEIFLRMNLMGLGSSLYTVTQCRTDRNFLLESFVFTIRSGVVQFHLSGRREGNSLILETGRGKDKKTHSLRLERIPLIGAGVTHFFKARKLQIGDSFSLPVFDPSTLSQKEMLIRVAAKEPLKISGLAYEAFRLETKVFGKDFSVWVGEDGSVLKEEGFMGLTTIKSSAAKASEDLDERGGADLYELTAVRPDRVIPDPNRLGVLKVRISGMENAHLDRGVLNGLRQEHHMEDLTIRKEKIPPGAGYTLPYKDENGRMSEFLKSEWNIESDAQEIRSKAIEIAGSGVDPQSAARRLMQWVYDHLEKKPVLSLPSALETLTTRVGDCNEHATLLTALLRAVGIPARLSIGLAYGRDRFFYHAWTEAFLGEWVSMDATLNQMPVDPAHIKLIEGNLEKQVEIAGLIGQIRLSILDFQYD